MSGVLVLVIYATIMLLATYVFTKKENSVEQFCVGNRNMGWIISALSIAATWIWAPALFTSTEKAYITGFVGLFWFLVPNILCLIVFIPFAKKIRKQMPEGITLSGYMYQKYNSDGVKKVYLFQLIGLSMLSTGVQLLAGSKVLSVITGLPFWTMTIALAAIAYSYSQFSGIRASILTDAIQAIFMVVICIALVIFGLKDIEAGQLTRGLAGVTGEYISLLDKKGIEIFLGFGLPTTIGLLSGPFGDQSFWQRAFSVQKKYIGKAFFIGAIIFAIVPLSMGILGFIGGGIEYQVNDLGIINFEIIKYLFPAWVTIPFLFMIISGLLSTVDSNLCAVASLTTDLIKNNKITHTRLSMVLLLIVGIAIANIPGLTVTHLFLFYGTLRASTLLPTILTLKGMQLSARGIVKGVITSLIIGLPIFAYGNLYNLAVFKTIGSLATVLLSGGVAMIISHLEVYHETNIR